MLWPGVFVRAVCSQPLNDEDVETHEGKALSTVTSLVQGEMAWRNCLEVHTRPCPRSMASLLAERRFEPSLPSFNSLSNPAMGSSQGGMELHRVEP